MAETAWLYDDPSVGYHAAGCPCPRHCGNCLTDLDQVRGDQRRLALLGRLHGSVLPLRARYCCDHCKGQAKRFRAGSRRMDAALAAATREAPGA